MSSVAIIDYGMANLRSVQKAVEFHGHTARIVSGAAEVRSAERLILPGVGAFADAVRVLREKGLDDAVRDFIDSGRPFLGICLGYQMLFDVGFEDGRWDGLGVYRGECVRLEVDKTLGLKVPHMGWNELTLLSDSPLFRGLTRPSVYFTHSYHVVPEERSLVAATTDYGGPFVVSIWRNNVMGTQFHPEKSQAAGLRMLANFAAMR